MNGSIKITGSVEATLTGPDGKVKYHHIAPNVVTTVGKQYLATWLATSTPPGTFMQYVALGSGTSAASVADTALQIELTVAGYSRASANLLSDGTTWGSISEFEPNNGAANISEIGIFSADTAGTMFAHQVFPTITKTSVDTLTFKWYITFA